MNDNSKIEDYLKPFYFRRNELHIERGCFMQEYRGIISCKMRNYSFETTDHDHRNL